VNTLGNVWRAAFSMERRVGGTYSLNELAPYQDSSDRHVPPPAKQPTERSLHVC